MKNADEPIKNGWKEDKGDGGGERNPRGPPLLGPMCREYNNKDVGEIGFLNLGSFCPLLKKGNF